MASKWCLKVREVGICPVSSARLLGTAMASLRVTRASRQGQSERERERGQSGQDSDKNDGKTKGQDKGPSERAK